MESSQNLASLCRNNGWLYVLVWGVDQRDPRLLVVQDGYCERQVKEIVDKMMNHVHVIGEGIIGETVAFGTSRWLYCDNYTTELYSAADAINPDFFKTTVLVPIASSGVAQFGSTRKVSESSAFIDHAMSFFDRKELRGVPVGVQYGTFPSSSSFRGSGFSYCEDSSFHSSIGDGMFKAVPSIELPNFNFETKKFSPDLRSYSNIVGPQVLTATMSSNSVGLCSQIQTPLLNRNSIPQPAKVKNLACSDTQAHFLLSTRSSSPSRCIGSSVPSCFYSDSCVKNSNLSLPHEGFFSSASISGFPHMLPANSFSVRHENMNNPFSRDSTSSSFQYSFDNLAIDASFCELNKALITNQTKPTNAKALKFPNVSVASIHDAVPQNTFDPKHGQTYNPFDSCQLPGFVSDEMIVKESQCGTISASSSTGCVPSSNMACQLPTLDVGHHCLDVNLHSSIDDDTNNCSLAAPAHIVLDEDLFDIMELDFGPCNFLPDYLSDIVIPSSSSASSISSSDCLSKKQKSLFEAEEVGPFSDMGLEQLLNSIAKENANKSISNHSVSQFSGYQLSSGAPVLKTEFLSTRIPSIGTSLPEHIRDVFEGSIKESSQMSSATNLLNDDDQCSINKGGFLLNQPTKTAETKKVKKRSRPCEGAKPRPKDRQQIQDRIKELRGIVPNCTKCSIDILLSQTIKYMLFLQSTMKYVEKIRQTNEPKMIFEENGVVLKDHSNDNSGSTWAYEVAGQTMVCPIIVEDVTPPGQLLVEMLCEDHGLFLEIADIIRGFGLTILKGIMEISGQKIWARFLVEANKDVTRMDIFLSLVQLLQATCTRSGRVESEVLEKETLIDLTGCQQPTMPISVGLCERLH